MDLNRLAGVGWSACLAVAERFDALPVSPPAVGDRLLHRTWAARERRAADDPEWAAIEALRGPDGDVELDLSVALDLSSRRTQDELAERAWPDPWWMPAAWWLSGARTADVLRSARSLAQRAVRGWSDADAAELGFLLPATVGAQLLVLADRAAQRIRDPDDPAYPEAMAFAEQLRAHGRTLVAGGDPAAESTRTLEAWNAVATTPGHDPGLERRLAEAHDRAVDDATQAKRASMVWVAEHLHDLWD